jgi:transcriptional regulator with XRE-family HTH domain
MTPADRAARYGSVTTRPPGGGRRVTKREELIALGRTIRRLRQAQHLTIAALASKAGLSANQPGAIELGHGNPTFTTLSALAGALGVTPSELVRAAEAETEGMVRDAHAE